MHPVEKVNFPLALEFIAIRRRLLLATGRSGSKPDSLAQASGLFFDGEKLHFETAQRIPAYSGQFGLDIGNELTHPLFFLA
jgi:hypothetical protein